jgi:hypothetical protein
MNVRREKTSWDSRARDDSQFYGCEGVRRKKGSFEVEAEAESKSKRV